MTTAQHKKAIDKLTTDFAELAGERRDLERVHGSFQSAFQNPYRDDMRNLNGRWDAKINQIRRAVKAAINDGVRNSTVAKWLKCVDNWNIIRDIILWDCERF